MGGVSDQPPDMSILAGQSACTHLFSGGSWPWPRMKNCNNNKSIMTSFPRYFTQQQQHRTSIARYFTQQQQQHHNISFPRYFTQKQPKEQQEEKSKMKSIYPLQAEQVEPDINLWGKNQVCLLFHSIFQSRSYHSLFYPIKFSSSGDTGCHCQWVRWLRSYGQTCPLGYCYMPFHR